MANSLLTSLILLFTCTTQAQIAARIDSLLSEANKKGVFSGNVLVANNGRVSYNSSVGFADQDKQILNDSLTQFQIGSITKVFTKTLIHKLIEDGKLSKTETIGKFFPDFPSEMKGITIQQLLDHTAGLGSYYDVVGYDQARSNFKSISDVLQFVKKEELQFQPGSRTAYSNSGYAVLAGITEKVTGDNYGNLLKIYIFDKLHMSHSRYAIINENETGKARGYLSSQPGKMKDNSDLDMTGAGDGGIYSTTGDLLKFIVSITSNNILLSDKSKLDLVNSPLFPVQYETWADFQRIGRFSVGGGSPGLSAVIGFSMETGNQIIVLSNYDEGTAEEVFRRIATILRGGEPESFKLAPARFIYTLFDKRSTYSLSEFNDALNSNGIELGDDDMALLFAGQALMQEKRWDEALSLYQIYTSQFPQIVVAWNDLGDVYVAKNNFSEAKRCYKKALSLRPGNQRASESLSKISNKK